MSLGRRDQAEGDTPWWEMPCWWERRSPGPGTLLLLFSFSQQSRCTMGQAPVATCGDADPTWEWGGELEGRLIYHSLKPLSAQQILPQ